MLNIVYGIFTFRIMVVARRKEERGIIHPQYRPAVIDWRANLKCKTTGKRKCGTRRQRLIAYWMWRFTSMSLSSASAHVDVAEDLATYCERTCMSVFLRKYITETIQRPTETNEQVGVGVIVGTLIQCVRGTRPRGR